ncbi:MAG: hypothetical protein J0H34_20770 [Rhizobiales bacterium]|nr:hypothetical protein [Hyphomicrobiales bacterium]
MKRETFTHLFGGWHSALRLLARGAVMTPAEVLDAIRDLVVAAEEQGWDTLPDLKSALDRGRDAYADLQIVLADADDDDEVAS